MTEEDIKNNTTEEESTEMELIEDNPTSESLANAISGSFVFLKIAMLILLALFISDRFVSVDDGEVMVIKRYGKYNTDDTGIKVYKPGSYHFILPYPIEEAVKIRTSEEKEIKLNYSFWPRIDAAAALAGDGSLPKSPELHPAFDRYNITGDLNILHSSWIIKYRINDYRAYLLSCTSQKATEELIQAIAEDSINQIFAGVSVDQAFYGDKQHLFDMITERIKNQLSVADIGIELTNLINQSLLPPGFAQDAFDKVRSSLSKRDELIDTAKKEANTLTKNAETEAQQIKNAALQYKVTVVSRAEADAGRIKDLMAKFPNDPEGLNIYLSQYRYDRLQDALKNARIYLMRDGKNIFWTAPANETFSDTPMSKE